MLQVLKNLWRKKWFKTTVIIGAAIVVIVTAAIIVFGNLFGGGSLNNQLDQDDLGILIDYSKEEDEKISGIVNIALFGIDTTDGAATIGDQYRSDCIMILSLDPSDNNFKIISILRDTKVPIDGHDPQKINAAYKYGGAQLAVKTVNQNFKTNIKDYVTVDFAHMAEIVDILGGLEIEVTAAEARNMAVNLPAKPVDAGLHLLDGEQVVTYSRVRKVDSDYYRASRQQHVLDLIFDKIKNMPTDKYPALVKSFMNCVETSLSYGDIMKIVRSFDLKSATIIKNTVPDPKYELNLRGGLDSTGSWVWTYDLEAASNRIHQIIYGRDLPQIQNEKTTTAQPATRNNNSNTYNNSYTHTQNNTVDYYYEEDNIIEQNEEGINATNEPLPEGDEEIIENENETETEAEIESEQNSESELITETESVQQTETDETTIQEIITEPQTEPEIIPTTQPQTEPAVETQQPQTTIQTEAEPLANNADNIAAFEFEE